MSSSDAVGIAVSITLIFAFTGYMIWTMNRKNRLYRELLKLVKDNADAEARKAAQEPDGDETQPPQRE
ncbi:MAG: hypothetical protein QOC81_3946 [Thermoanaerobaculia bacterium]|jgi:hypothetical protein|nr:hypothetical protein [Thermoanaerobaculia bacterium]